MKHCLFICYFHLTSNALTRTTEQPNDKDLPASSSAVYPLLKYRAPRKPIRHSSTPLHEQACIYRSARGGVWGVLICLFVVSRHKGLKESPRKRFSLSNASRLGLGPIFGAAYMLVRGIACSYRGVLRQQGRAHPSSNLSATERRAVKISLYRPHVGAPKKSLSTKFQRRVSRLGQQGSGSLLVACLTFWAAYRNLPAPCRK